MTMKLTVAVASGKGGTGKTTVSASLALAAADEGYKVTYRDCDVEEPNGHIFLKPRIERRETVGIPVPAVDLEKCTFCGACGDICQFSAIISVSKSVIIFEQMCHGCGGCTLVCPASAITEKNRGIGVMESGHAGGIGFLHGRINVGEALSPPLVKAVRSAELDGGLNIVDAPPGTSCPVIAAVKGADFVLLVTEPTPFGLHDLEIAVDMVKELGIAYAVVVNRADPAYPMARDYCKEKNIKILAEIPDDRRVAEAYSNGKLPYSAVPGYRERFEELLADIVKEASQQ